MSDEWTEMRVKRVTIHAGFVLLEVIVSLTILGVAVAFLMRSFTDSFNSAKKMEIYTQASFLAQQLMDEFEVYPPAENKVEAGFGDSYPGYSYRATKTYVTPRYRLRGGNKEIERFFATRMLEIEIHYKDETSKDFVACKVSTSIVGFEKFSPQTKVSYSTKSE